MDEIITEVIKRISEDALKDETHDGTFAPTPESNTLADQLDTEAYFRNDYLS